MTIKECKLCQTPYKKNVKYSKKQWDKSKFCSRECQYKGKDSSSLIKARKCRKGFDAISGSNSHLWKGGITPINEKIRKSAKNKKWIKRILERDDYTCQLCGKRGGDLEVDHIKPFAYFPKLRFVMSNGRTLCKGCHRKTDTYGEKAKKHKIRNALVEGKSLEEYIATL